MLDVNKQQLPEITEDTLLKMADDMASAATAFSAHGYDHFVSARENFKVVSKHIFDTYINKPHLDS